MYLGRNGGGGRLAPRCSRGPARTPTREALVSAIPGQGPRIRLEGEISSPIDPPPQVCRFASRCPAAQDRCLREAAAAAWPLGAAGARRHAARLRMLPRAAPGGLPLRRWQPAAGLQARPQARC
jgi:hypothetical protein